MEHELVKPMLSGYTEVINSVQSWLHFFVLLVLLIFAYLMLLRHDAKMKNKTDEETFERIKKRDEEHLKRDHRIEEIEKTQDTFSSVPEKLHDIEITLAVIKKSMEQLEKFFEHERR